VTAASAVRLALALALPLGVWPAGASASTDVTFHVVNQRGTPQYAYARVNDQTWYDATPTSGGDVTLSVAAGDQVRFTRNTHLDNPFAQPVAAPPEGTDGQLYTVPSPPQPTVTVTLPNVQDDYHPELSDPERWIVGKLNADRAALGRQPLKLSTTLSEAASAMARDEAVNARFPDPQLWVIDQDWGWPGDPYHTGYVAADAPYANPARVLPHWDGTANDGESGQIWSALSDPGLSAVGIADGGGAWIIDAMYGCPDLARAAACGIGSDTGDPNVYAPDLTPPAISILAPVNGAHLAQGAVVDASYGCADNPGGQGLANCAGPVPNGARIDTSTAGAKTFTVTATDNVGNVSTKSVSYTVDGPAGGTGGTGGSSGGSGGGGSAPAVLHLTSSNIKVVRGIAQLVAGCGKGHGPCRAALRLTFGTKHPTVLGRATATVPEGRRVTIPIRLTRKARALLAHASSHHLHATLSIDGVKHMVLLARVRD
jgi:hypothetical protein